MTFEDELIILINKHSVDNDCNTPDFILAGFAHSCLLAFANAVGRRDAHAKGGMWPVDTPVVEWTERNPYPVQVAHDLYGTEIGKVWANDKPPFLPPDLNQYPLGPEPFPVEGHAPECKIDLAVDWHDCTCGAG